MCGWISLLQTTNKFVNLQGELHNEKSDDSDARHGDRFHRRGPDLRRPGHHQDEGPEKGQEGPQEVNHQERHQSLGFPSENRRIAVTGYPALPLPHSFPSPLLASLVSALHFHPAHFLPISRESHIPVYTTDLEI